MLSDSTSHFNLTLLKDIIIIAFITMYEMPTTTEATTSSKVSYECKNQTHNNVTKQ